MLKEVSSLQYDNDGDQDRISPLSHNRVINARAEMALQHLEDEERRLRKALKRNRKAQEAMTIVVALLR